MKKCDATISVRPWGTYEVLTTAGTHQVKRIIVLPGKRLSLQRHKQRAEHWYVVEGSGLATVDDRTWIVVPGNAIDVARGATHRIENNGTTELVFIEVQTGDYFGEDDIERLQDDFGRK